MSSSLELSSLVDFLSVFRSSRLQCSTACARRSHSPQPPPAPCPLIFSSPACTILLCDHWGDPARHPVLKTACHRRGRLTEIRPLIRSSDWGGVGGGGASWQAKTDRHPRRPNQQQLDTHLLSGISPAFLEWRCALYRPVNVIHCPPPYTAGLLPQLSVCGDTWRHCPGERLSKKPQGLERRYKY